MKKKLLVIALLLSAICSHSQTEAPKIDTLEFQIAYPNSKSSALEQLQSYPSPRYLPQNNFIRLFNWMNSNYMGGAGQVGITPAAAIKNASALQEELALNWNYCFVIHNSGSANSPKACENQNTLLRSIIELANKYPDIPLGVTTFWGQIHPSTFGFKQKQPNILRSDLPDSLYIKDATGKVIKRYLNFAAPDSLFIKDGIIQRMYIQNLLRCLKRPINFINENGEEPPGMWDKKVNLTGDKNMIADKNKLGIKDWHIYISEKKKHMRQLYASQFMDSLPELKNTWFTLYNVEGGPIDRFDWASSKATCSKIKGNYYSTPDFYPRTPDNWKLWRGAWHGWKWINDGRKIEIKDGDRFFSPFIAAGWSKNPETDIRPAQWLGLLKCLSVVGAEFYYSAYFNLKQPFSAPENYVWQIAMPAYAQAITTHFADIFKSGNVLFDSKKMPVVTYPVNDKDVLVTIRKHDQKEQYVIAATVQPFSNTKTYPLQKIVEITLKEETILFNIRRQGSVYIYDKSVDPPIFYQLDRWHQYEHPERWRKYWINEAEVFDTASNAANQLIKSVYSKNNSIVDFSNVESYLSLNKNQWVQYSIYERDLQHLKAPLYIMMYVKSKNSISLNITSDKTEQKIQHQKASEWEWLIYPLPINNTGNVLRAIKLQSLNDGVEIDKIIISDSEAIPDLKSY